MEYSIPYESHTLFCDNFCVAPVNPALTVKPKFSVGCPMGPSREIISIAETEDKSANGRAGLKRLRWIYH